MMLLRKQFTAYVLLLCLAVSTFPWNLLHHHQQEDFYCEKADSSLLNDPCHRSIFHPNDLQELECDHKTHIDKKHDHCEFCKFITSRHNNYVVPYNYSFFQFDSLDEQISFEHSFYTISFPGVIYNRGPPA